MTEAQAFHSLGPYLYCPLCGGLLEVSRRAELPRRYCGRCEQVYYHNPAPAAGGVIEREGRVLLVRRKFRPRAGEWTFPAGFLEYFESPADCAVREVHEETGLLTRIDGIFGVYAGHDDPRRTCVLILYRMSVTGGDARPGDDAAEVRFFGPEDMPEEVAFRAHQVALRELYGDRLRTAWAQPVGDSLRKR